MACAKHLDGLLGFTQDHVLATEPGAAAHHHGGGVVLAEEFESVLVWVGVERVGGDLGLAVFEPHRHRAAGPHAGDIQIAEVRVVLARLGRGLGLGRRDRFSADQINGELLSAEVRVGQGDGDGAVGVGRVDAGDQRRGAELGLGFCAARLGLRGVARERNGEAVRPQAERRLPVFVGGVGFNGADKDGFSQACEPA